MIGIETGIEIPKPISEYKFHPLFMTLCVIHEVVFRG